MLSIAMIFQNEASYLKEWIEFHKLVGVEHFYLYNNLSQDNYREILQPYIDSGEVDLIEWLYPSNNMPDWESLQIKAYNNALERSRSKTKWLAIIDADEFIVPIQSKDLKVFLAQFETDKTIGGVTANWINFGTSNVKKIPDDKLMIETLLMNSGPIKTNFKSIIQVDKVSCLSTPHVAIYKEGYHAYEIPFDQVQINHYWSRDEEFLQKIKIWRRALWGTTGRSCILYAQSLNSSHPSCNGILRFADKLRQRLKDIDS